jgi:hypothetical protein
MTDTEIALRAAINVLRDTIESGRMPSRLKLTPDAAALHERAARHLEAMLQRCQQPRVTTGEPPCELDPSTCYRDCSQRHVCQWQREQIDYWEARRLFDQAKAAKTETSDG